MYTGLSEKTGDDILSQIKIHLDLDKKLYKNKPDFVSPVTMTMNEDGENADKIPIISFTDCTISLDVIKLHDITRINSKFKDMHDLFEIFSRRFLLLVEYRAKVLASKAILLRTKNDMLAEIASEKGYKITLVETMQGKVYELHKIIKLIKEC